VAGRFSDFSTWNRVAIERWEHELNVDSRTARRRAAAGHRLSFPVQYTSVSNQSMLCFLPLPESHLCGDQHDFFRFILDLTLQTVEHYSESSTAQTEIGKMRSQEPSAKFNEEKFL
jgi:hypothetical protein